MISNLSHQLGKVLLPTHITITVMTVGGTDWDGNEVEEPIVFVGSYVEAKAFLDNSHNLRRINTLMENMSDGYIMVECGNYDRQVYDVYDIMEAIEEMV